MDSSRSPTDALLGEVAFVHRFARALLRDSSMAHDVAQDALAQALQQQPAHHVRGWLAAVTRHLAGRAGRAARDRATREARAARPPAGDDEARTVERLRLHRRLTDAVTALPEPYRTAVTLRFFDELPPRAIARRLGMPPATVRQHVHRGLAMLRQQLDGEFDGREPWRGAFGAIVLGKAAVPLLVGLPVLAMKKLFVGALLVAAVVGGWWLSPRGDALPVATPVASSPAPPVTTPAANAAPGVDAAHAEAVRIAVAVPATRDETFAVLVVDEREQPIAGAGVHRWTEGGAIAEQRTDRDGRAEFAALDGAGGMLVCATGWPPMVRELALLRGEQRCTLADGAVLAGQMLVDGTPAPPGLGLGIYTGLVLPASAPDALRRRFPGQLPAATAVTGPAGSFVFRGLVADRQVTVELPRTHWFLPENEILVEGRHGLSGRSLLPAHGAVLRTTRLPHLDGRVVWADDGTPVARAELDCHARFADGESTPLTGMLGSEDGTFALGFYPGSPESWLRWCEPSRRPRLVAVTVRASAPGSDGALRLDLDDKAMAAMPVELRLPRAAVTHFMVTDLDDRPLAGARVSAEASTPTDAQGRGTFQGRLERLLVGSDGYQVQPAVSRRPAAGTGNDPLLFRLAPRNQIELCVRTPDGAVPPFRWVRITSDAAMFEGKRFRYSFDETFGGSKGNCSSSARKLPDGSYETYRWDCTVLPEAGARMTLHSWQPGVRCTADVMGALDEVIASATFVTPAPGATLAIELVVRNAAQTVFGRVQTHDATPLAKASVVLGRGNGSTEVSTGFDGGFRFTGVYGDAPLQLSAKAPGYAGTSRQIAAADASEQVVVLDQGRRVTLHVVDEAGKPVAVAARAEQVAGHSLHPQTVQPGEHLFTDLPSGILTFEAAFGGQTFRIQHDTSDPHAVLRVPRPARLAVVIRTDGRDRTDDLAVRATPLAGGERFSVRAVPADASDAAVLVVPGRYRVELVRYGWRGVGGTRERVEETAAPAQEVAAKPGELTRIVL